MDAKKSNKIRDIVRLQQILKKYNSVSSTSTTTEYIPKGFLAVCVGKELKRYVIPTEYLGHQAFGILLREAEEEFGFHQEGVLKIPCDVVVFEKILKLVQQKRDEFYLHDLGNHNNEDEFEFHASDIDVMSSSLSTGCCSPDSEHILQPHLPQLCR
ncbi:Auxin-responsive protein SAUR71 [Bienertia sinuspersici]